MRTCGQRDRQTDRQTWWAWNVSIWNLSYRKCYELLQLLWVTLSYRKSQHYCSCCQSPCRTASHNTTAAVASHHVVPQVTTLLQLLWVTLSYRKSQHYCSCCESPCHTASHNITAAVVSHPAVPQVTTLSQLTAPLEKQSTACGKEAELDHKFTFLLYTLSLSTPCNFGKKKSPKKIFQHERSFSCTKCVRQDTIIVIIAISFIFIFGSRLLSQFMAVTNCYKPKCCNKNI